jgi:rhodanese-related sulfurtransferase
MKKFVILAASLALASSIMFGCSSAEETATEMADTATETATEATDAATEAVTEVTETGTEMQYISADEVLAAVEAHDSSMVIVDLRNTEDYDAGHIEGSIPASMQKAVEDGDYADGIANLTTALGIASGADLDADKKIVLVCYTGKKYAQAGTDVLNALGADLSNVYTLENGAKGWTEAGNPMVTD